MLDSAFSYRIKLLALAALMVFIWIVLGMVYTDRFFPPFERLELWLMPWKELYTAPQEGSTDMRLSMLQELLDASNRVAQYSFVVMIASFSVFSMFLSVVYQQKQRKARENMLLVLKNQEIARRNEFIRYISATISHEFKNNLGRIKRRIDLLPALPREAQERIDGNMEKLFADIDIFKRISDGREAGLVEFERVDLRMLLETSAIHYADLVDLSLQKSSLMPMIYASPPLLKTVFENLIDNSVKYKKPESERARVDVSCSLEQDDGRRYVVISFRDEGKGMDARQADLCFYKGRTNGEGWGQGLYYAKYVIGLHAGKIRIGAEYTSPGVGTEIIIKLPFVEEAQHV